MATTNRRIGSSHDVLRQSAQYLYGAVANMCDELACRIPDCSDRTRELVAEDNPETTIIPTDW